MSGQRHAPTAFCYGERTPGTHCTGGWVGLRAGLDTKIRGKILCPCRGSNPDRPVLQSVVRHYTGNPKQVNVQVVLSRTITQHTARCHNFGRSLTTVVLTACNLLLFSSWTLCADTALLHARPVWPHFLGLCLSNNNFQGTGPSTSYN
jgi:hypothetical protein